MDQNGIPNIHTSFRFLLLRDILPRKQRDSVLIIELVQVIIVLLLTIAVRSHVFQQVLRFDQIRGENRVDRRMQHRNKVVVIRNVIHWNHRDARVLNLVRFRLRGFR